MTQGKLPLRWTEFVGRRRERTSLSRLVRRARLITVVGLSGVGKSRLARQVAEELLSEFEGRVWFADCGGLEDAGALLPQFRETAIGESLRAVAEGGPAAAPPARALLLLDSAECLLGRGLEPLLHQWLEQAPDLTLLVTSLSPLGLPGEHLFPLRAMYPPNELPGAGEGPAWSPSPQPAGDRTGSPDLLEVEGLRLFEARAQQRDCEWRLTSENLTTVVALCREMDWLPLGIELVAGQLSPWSAEQLLTQIRRQGHALDLSVAGAIERHSSLRRAVAWSWSALTEEEQSLLGLFAALGGQLPEEALEPLNGDPHGPSRAALLFHKGFLRVEERAGRLRYAMPEAIRWFAAAETAVPEGVRERATRFYLELAEREGSRLGTPQAAAAAAVLRGEMPVLRRCWSWAMERPDGPLLRGFAQALWGPLLYDLELPAAARELAAAALNHRPVSGDEGARLAWIAGATAVRLGSTDEAAAYLRQCLEAGAAAPVRALALKELGQLQLLQGQPLAAGETLQQSAAALSQLGMEAEAAWARRALAGALERLGDRGGAQRLLDEARLQFTELDLPAGQASACADLARLAADEERWAAADARGWEAVRHYHGLDHAAGWATAILQVARVRSGQGAFEEAQSLYQAAFDRLRATGSAVPICQGLLLAAAEPHAGARPLDPARAYRECICLARERGLRSHLAHALRGLADLYAGEGAPDRALSLAEEAVKVARQTTETPLIQACLDLLGRIQAPARRSGQRGLPPVHVEALVVRELPTTAALPAASSGLNGGGQAPSGRVSVGSRETAVIRVRLLGGMSLFLGEAEIPLLDWWAKAKKLFAYLVIHRSRPVSRDILLEEFWAEGDQQRAIHSLQTTLSFLRRSLRSLSAGENFAERLIVARDGNYLFDTENRCESDLQQFDHHFQEAARLKAAGRLEEAAAHWMEADRLYVGDLLPEFPYEDWCASPRERVRSHYLELLLNLGTYHRQAQRPREALRTAERMFAIDACDERAHRMAMRCHVQLGRPVDALRQFERCAQILERELRVQPSKATRDLHELIRRRMEGSPPPASDQRGDSLSAGAL